MYGKSARDPIPFMMAPTGLVKTKYMWHCKDKRGKKGESYQVQNFPHLEKRGKEQYSLPHRGNWTTVVGLWAFCNLP
jgi:hypothetical protein